MDRAVLDPPRSPQRSLQLHSPPSSAQDIANNETYYYPLDPAVKLSESETEVFTEDQRRQQGAGNLAAKYVTDKTYAIRWGREKAPRACGAGRPSALNDAQARFDQSVEPLADAGCPGRKPPCGPPGHPFPSRQNAASSLAKGAYRLCKRQKRFGRKAAKSWAW